MFVFVVSIFCVGLFARPMHSTSKFAMTVLSKCVCVCVCVCEDEAIPMWMSQPHACAGSSQNLDEKLQACIESKTQLSGSDLRRQPCCAPPMCKLTNESVGVKFEEVQSPRPARTWSLAIHAWHPRPSDQGDRRTAEEQMLQFSP